jgi:hypothetical protein
VWCVSREAFTGRTWGREEEGLLLPLIRRRWTSDGAWGEGTTVTGRSWLRSGGACCWGVDTEHNCRRLEANLKWRDRGWSRWKWRCPALGTQHVEDERLVLQHQVSICRASGARTRRLGQGGEHLRARSSTPHTTLDITSNPSRSCIAANAPPFRPCRRLRLLRVSFAGYASGRPPPF